MSTTPSTATRLTEARLLDLAEGSVVITHGNAWAKIGPDLWRCPFREHVPDYSIAAKNQRFIWHDEKDSEWLAELATSVVFDYAEWESTR